MRKTIVVHNGAFQADEVFAVAFLIMYYPGLQIDVKSLLERDDYPFEIIRTRDQDIIDKADIVCDVGGVHSPINLRFDHHQWEKPKDADPQWYTIPKGLHGDWHAKAKVTPSSCGLVLDYLWHYHHSKKTGLLPTELVNRFFKFLVLGIDAVDNGMAQVPKDIKLRYKPFNISEQIKHYNAEEDISEEQDINFHRAVDVALFHLRYWDSGFYRDQVNYVPFKELIDAQSGDHLCMPKFYKGWRGMLNRAKALKKYKRIVWPTIDEKGQREWRVQVPPKEPGSFEFTVPPLDGSKVNPEHPYGHSTGDLVFVHSGHWIGATRTKEAAYKL